MHVKGMSEIGLKRLKRPMKESLTVSSCICTIHKWGDVCIQKTRLIWNNSSQEIQSETGITYNISTKLKTTASKIWYWLSGTKMRRRAMKCFHQKYRKSRREDGPSFLRWD